MTQSADFAKQCDGRQLLYIDDDALALKSLTVLLQTMGYGVDSADDVNQGLSMFSEGNYALVITDMNMPGMNGLRLTEEIKRIRPDTPVVIISGSIDIDTKNLAINSRPDCVLVKPLIFSEFTTHLNRLMNQGASTDEG